MEVVDRSARRSLNRNRLSSHQENNKEDEVDDSGQREERNPSGVLLDPSEDERERRVAGSVADQNESDPVHSEGARDEGLPWSCGDGFSREC